MNDCTLEPRVIAIEKKITGFEKLHEDLKAIKYMFAGGLAVLIVDTLGIVESVRLLLS